MPDVTRLVGQLLSKTYRVAWKVRNESAEQEKLIAVLEDAIKAVDRVSTSGGTEDEA
jgi:hypothetical protein